MKELEIKEIGKKYIRRMDIKEALRAKNAEYIICIWVI